MGRHYYKKLGKNISQDFEHLYNKILRQEEYHLEKDALGKAIFFGNEDELHCYNIIGYLAQKNSENYGDKNHQKMLMFLDRALDKLKEEYPSEYDIIQLYYFSDKKVTQQEIGKHNNITKQAVNKKLKKACLHLKEYIIMYKETD